jgi:predicted RNA-binding protein with PIN domain
MRPGCRCIVVDGHSVLFRQPPGGGRGAPGAKARQKLVDLLQQAQDHGGVKVAVVFDGRGGQASAARPGEVEVRYAAQHQTADALIERAVASFRRPGEITVVTDDAGEASTLGMLGADVIGVDHFFLMVRETCPGWVLERYETA